MLPKPGASSSGVRGQKSFPARRCGPVLRAKGSPGFRETSHEMSSFPGPPWTECGVLRGSRGGGSEGWGNGRNL